MVVSVSGAPNAGCASAASTEERKTESNFGQRVAAAVDLRGETLTIELGEHLALKAIFNWGMVQTPPLFPFHRFGVLEEEIRETRDRRLTGDEEKRLLDAALEKMNTAEHQYVVPCSTIASNDERRLDRTPACSAVPLESTSRASRPPTIQLMLGRASIQQRQAIPQRDGRRMEERIGSEPEERRPTASPGVGKLIGLVS